MVHWVAVIIRYRLEVRIAATPPVVWGGLVGTPRDTDARARGMPVARAGRRCEQLPV